MTIAIGLSVVLGFVMLISGLEVRKNCTYRSTARNALIFIFIGAVLIVGGVYFAVQSQVTS